LQLAPPGTVEYRRLPQISRMTLPHRLTKAQFSHSRLAEKLTEDAFQVSIDEGSVPSLHVAEHRFDIVVVERDDVATTVPRSIAATRDRATPIRERSTEKQPEPSSRSEPTLELVEGWISGVIRIVLTFDDDLRSRFQDRLGKPLEQTALKCVHVGNVNSFAPIMDDVLADRHG
jgi:hypothetical protein